MSREALTCLEKIDVCALETEIAESVSADLRHLHIVYVSERQASEATACPRMLFTEAINYLYARLAVIDTKSGALIQSNALLAAVAAIAATILPPLNCYSTAHTFILFCIASSMVFAGVGAFFSLRAARLKFERCGQADHYVKRIFSHRIGESDEWKAILVGYGDGAEQERVQHILDYIVTILCVTALRLRHIRNARISAACSIGFLFSAVPAGLTILWLG